MFIGTIIKQYRQDNNLSLEDFSLASGLDIQTLESLENIYKDKDQNPVPVAMRDLKAISQVIKQPIPMLMMQIGSDQPIEVNVVAESDQPHAK